MRDAAEQDEADQARAYRSFAASPVVGGQSQDRREEPSVTRGAEADAWTAAWRTNARATAYLVEHLPRSVWSTQVPGIPRLTVGMIAAHIHNSRCRWIRASVHPMALRCPSW